ncbi:MAG TPA: hypothetical protein VKX45_15120 [Bryobacteraceae bacterium]|jgi:hypothetical protein|nr:hypothetical protein [Bryobacteraceae bacterium]
MKRIYVWSAAFASFAITASAQDAPLAQQVKVMGIGGAVMGKTVKGAPYSGTEITETTQTLGDGTRIHNETQTQVYRDSEGRVRRESGDIVNIFDPVGNASYMLDAKTQTARKLPLGTYFFQSTADGAAAKTNIQWFRYSDNGGPLPPPPPLPGDPSAAHADAIKAKLKAEAAQLQVMQDSLGAARAGKVAIALKHGAGELHSESLGRRQIEGVNADGTRDTETIAAGAIGNDRPIQSVTERWYSPDLQTFIQTRHSDPRTGEETFRLTNIVRAEPPAYLFQVPASYQIH